MSTPREFRNISALQFPTLNKNILLVRVSSFFICTSFIRGHVFPYPGKLQGSVSSLFENSFLGVSAEFLFRKITYGGPFCEVSSFDDPAQILQQ